ncbi:MAG: hypothetical protein K2X82_06035 [Gemmataceae bacterium]|nr:hypothetical protein [Gemmataceae bacterium]
MSALTRTLKSWLKPAAPAARTARLGMEPLEDREVLSAVLADGLLTIKGTTGDDVIRVSQSGDTLRVEERLAGRAATTSTFSAARVSKVLAYGYEGKDSISLHGVNEAAELRGGPGNDSLYGGLRGDTIYGQGGHDQVYGNEGSDTLNGGLGNDSLFGYTGNDVLPGGDGADALRGGDGNDYLNGGAGSDTVTGGLGTDTFRRSLFIPGPGFSLGQQPVEKDREDEKADIPIEVTGSFLTEERTSSSRDGQWHVNQDGSPTCSFLAALAAYAERTGANNDLVQKIKYDAAADKYGVRLYVGGQWKTVWVNGDWTEGRDPGGRLWVTLYQKAYLQAWNVQTRDADGRLLAGGSWSSPRGPGG